MTDILVVLTELLGVSSVAISPDGGRLLEDAVPFLNRIDVVSRDGEFSIVDEARSSFSFGRGLLFRWRLSQLRAPRFAWTASSGASAPGILSSRTAGPRPRYG